MSAIRGDQPPASSPLIGREKELDRLVQLVERAPAIATVEGEAGVGKTRLVGELLQPGRVPQRCLVLVGHCQPVREPFPFGPISDALSGATRLLDGVRFGSGTGAVARILPELRWNLPEPPEPLDDPRADRHVLLRALREFLRDLGPAILCLEDLHWADEATVELLVFLKAQFPPDLVVVGTYRGEEVEAGSPLRTMCSRLEAEVAAEHLELAAMDVGEVGQLVSAILQTGEVSEEFAAHLCDRTGGIPFAVEEVVRLLQERRDITRQDKRWVRAELDEFEVPGTLAASILERLEKLGPGARSMVEAASVLGASSTDGLIARVAGVLREAMEEAGSVALTSALLQEEPEGRMGFRHPLARQAVHDSIPGPRRRAMHLRAALELVDTRPSPLSRLARHFREAGEWSNWLYYAEAAADLAISLGEDAEAFRLLRDLIHSHRIPEAARARIVIKFGRVAYHVSPYEDSIRILHRILAEEELQTSTRGELRLLLGLLLNQMQDDSSSYVQIARSVPELEERPELQARAMAALAIPTMYGHVSEHLEWSRRATRLIGRLEDPVLKTAVLGNHAAILMASGDAEAWSVLKSVPPANTVARQRERLRLSFNMADQTFMVGHYRRAETFLGEAKSLAELLSYDGLSFDIREVESVLDWAAGRWGLLEETCRGLCAEAAAAGKPLAYTVIVLGSLLGARTHFAEAEAHLVDAARLSEARGSVSGYSWAKAARARVLLADGRKERAADEALEGVEAIRGTGIWAWAGEVLPTAVEALLASGDERHAAHLTDELSEGIAKRDAPAGHAALATCRGMIAAASGSDEAAATHYERSQQLWGSLGRRYEAARALEGRGDVILRSGGDEGRRSLETALDRFDELGAVWDSARVRRTTRDHGMSLVHRRGRRGYGRELSPRERQVVDLVTQGLTNPEIASRLFLSPSTVKQHVSSAKRKLGAASRQQLSTVESVTIK